MVTKTNNYTKFNGLQGFLNLLLFGTALPSKMLDGKYYPLSKKIAEYFHDCQKNFIPTNEVGLKILEETLIEITAVKEFRTLRRELVKCYHGSRVNRMVDFMILQQKKSYTIDDMYIDIGSADLMRVFSSLPYVPIHLKVYITNHFVDFFETFNPYKGKISKRKYESLLEKYLKNNTLYKIRLNIEKHEIINRWK